MPSGENGMSFACAWQSGRMTMDYHLPSGAGVGRPRTEDLTHGVHPRRQCSRFPSAARRSPASQQVQRSHQARSLAAMALERRIRAWKQSGRPPSILRRVRNFTPSPSFLLTRAQNINGAKVYGENRRFSFFSLLSQQPSLRSAGVSPASSDGRYFTVAVEAMRRAKRPPRSIHAGQFSALCWQMPVRRLQARCLRYECSCARRQNDNCEVAIANRSAVKVNKKTEDAETPQNRHIFDHAAAPKIRAVAPAYCRLPPAYCLLSVS